MADQKSRGGQKQGHEKEAQGKENRDVRAGQQPPRDMAEDARKGQQGNQGGYERNQPRSGER